MADERCIVRNRSPHNYRGWDTGPNRHITILAGQLGIVSAVKKAQLLTDFPDQFEDCGIAGQLAAPAEAPNVILVADALPPVRSPRVTKPAEPERRKRGRPRKNPA
jgi:hypothetical protein